MKEIFYLEFYSDDWCELMWVAGVALGSLLLIQFMQCKGLPIPFLSPLGPPHCPLPLHFLLQMPFSFSYILHIFLWRRCYSYSNFKFLTSTKVNETLNKWSIDSIRRTIIKCLNLNYSKINHSRFSDQIII